MILSPDQIEIIKTALSYMYSNVDDVNEAFGHDFGELSVASLLEEWRAFQCQQQLDVNSLTGPPMTAQQINSVKCAYTDLVGSQQAYQKLDLSEHNWKTQMLTIRELEERFPFIEPVPLDPTYGDEEDDDADVQD